jgi:hypothetical protein
MLLVGASNWRTPRNNGWDLMPRLILNARMYAVSPEAEAAWRMLLERVVEMAGLADGRNGVSFVYEPYPAPQPLEVLWRRDDLGCAFMCGYPIALKLADVTPIAAPIPRADWAQEPVPFGSKRSEPKGPAQGLDSGAIPYRSDGPIRLGNALGGAVYRSDLIVRRDASYRKLEETFAGRLGWTVEHSHSGFNALRHHLMHYRTAERPTLYADVKGGLVTARAILDAVVAGSIDIGPLDAYWHVLIQRYRPELTANIRVLQSTALAPMPAFVAGPAVPTEAIDALKSAFVAAAGEAWFGPIGDALEIVGFAPVDQSSFARTLAWDEAAKAAGYPYPA